MMISLRSAAFCEMGSFLRSRIGIGVWRVVLCFRDKSQQKLRFFVGGVL